QRPGRSEVEPVKVEFLFDFGSPNAYLGRVIPDIERRAGVKFAYVPVLLGGVFKLTNNRSPGESFAGVKNKLQYMEPETERFIRRHTLSAPPIITCGKSRRRWMTRRSRAMRSSPPISTSTACSRAQQQDVKDRHGTDAGCG